MWKFRLIKSEVLKAKKLYFYGLISCCMIMPSVMALPVYYQDLNYFNLSKAKKPVDNPVIPLLDPIIKSILSITFGITSLICTGPS